MTTTSASAPRSSAPSPLRASRALRAGFIVPAGLGLVGTLVALIGSWNVSLWTDEAATIAAARRTPAELWALVQHIDAVHALYYFAMQAWASVFGYSPVALRLPSALAVGVCVVGVYSLATALRRQDAAVVAALVTVVLPRVTWMGIEARSFGPSAAVAVWATVALVWAVRRGRGLWVAYGCLAALGIALNIYVALLVVAHGVTVALLGDVPLRRRLAWVVAAGAATLAASPVILLAASQKGQLGDNSVSTTTMLRRAVVNQWFLGETPTRVDSSNDGTALWAVAAIVLAVVCWSWIAAAIAKSLSRRGRLDPSRRVAIAVLVPWLLVPTTMVVVYSIAVSPLYNARYFTFCAPALAILVGLGIHTSRSVRLHAAAVVVIVALAVPIYVSQRGATAKSGTDWSLAAAYVEHNVEPGDAVYFSPQEPTTSATVGRSTRGIAVAYPKAFAGLTDITLDVSGPSGGTLASTSRQLAASTSRLDGADRLWVVRPRDYPSAATRTETRLLEAEGFGAGARWIGPMDEITEFTRR